MASDNSPTTTRTPVTNSPNLSAATMSKLLALLFQRSADATPAPIRPMAPSGAIGILSPGSRNASATIAAMAAAATHDIGTMAFSDCQLIVGPRSKAQQPDRRRVAPQPVPAPAD